MTAKPLIGPGMSASWLRQPLWKYSLEFLPCQPSALLASAPQRLEPYTTQLMLEALQCGHITRNCKIINKSPVCAPQPFTLYRQTSSRLQGCGRAAPPTPPVSIEVGGRTREFISVVPESYDSDVPHRFRLIR